MNFPMLILSSDNCCIFISNFHSDLNWKLTFFAATKPLHESERQESIYRHVSDDTYHLFANVIALFFFTWRWDLRRSTSERILNLNFLSLPLIKKIIRRLHCSRWMELVVFGGKFQHHFKGQVRRYLTIPTSRQMYGTKDKLNPIRGIDNLNVTKTICNPRHEMTVTFILVNLTFESTSFIRV